MSRVLLAAFAFHHAESLGKQDCVVIDESSTCKEGTLRPSSGPVDVVLASDCQPSDEINEADFDSECVVVDLKLSSWTICSPDALKQANITNCPSLDAPIASQAKMLIVLFVIAGIFSAIIAIRPANLVRSADVYWFADFCMSISVSSIISTRVMEATIHYPMIRAFSYQFLITQFALYAFWEIPILFWANGDKNFLSRRYPSFRRGCAVLSGPIGVIPVVMYAMVWTSVAIMVAHQPVPVLILGKHMLVFGILNFCLSLARKFARTFLLGRQLGLFRFAAFTERHIEIHYPEALNLKEDKNKQLLDKRYYA